MEQTAIVRERCYTMTALVLTFGSLGALGLITVIGFLVYRQEFNNRCGWCFGSGREWCQESAPRCGACQGTGVMTIHDSRTLALPAAKAARPVTRLVRDRQSPNPQEKKNP
jgi:hypothetical protein